MPQRLPQSRCEASSGSILLLLLREQGCEVGASRRSRWQSKRRLSWYSLDTSIECGLVLELCAHRIERRIWQQTGRGARHG